MKVAIGLSGGVDSSVAACLLKEQGHDVVGVTMLIWPDSKCCSGEAVEDARRVAKYLGIEHHIYDLIPEFTQEIVNVLVSEYSNGRTPNPCPTCNYKMKFDYLWNAVSQRHPDIEKIATGHYVNISYNEESQRYQLFKGFDKNKDQSYMLYLLNQQQLSRVMLPIGKYDKKETRKIASRLDLDYVATKPESMDLCFTSGNLKEFLRNKAPEKAIAGDIITTHGKKIGSHDGIIHYTVGQRKGLTIATGERMFVVSIDPLSNTIVVGNKDETYSPGLIADEVNWVSIPEPNVPILAEVKTRYLANPEPAEIIPLGNGSVKIVFKEQQSSIAPGQATVFYSGEMLLGGGTICKVIN